MDVLTLKIVLPLCSVVSCQEILLLLQRNTLCWIKTPFPPWDFLVSCVQSTWFFSDLVGCWSRGVRVSRNPAGRVFPPGIHSVPGDRGQWEMEECWSWNALLRWITHNRNKQDLGRSQADVKKRYSVRDSEPGLAFLSEKRLIAIIVKWHYSPKQRQMIYVSGDMLKGAYPGPPSSLMYKMVAPPGKKTQQKLHLNTGLSWN